MKQKLDAERERLAPTYNATTCSGTKGEYFVKGWDTAVETVLRVLREEGGEFDEEALKIASYNEANVFLRDMISRGKAAEIAFNLAKQQHQQIQPVIAALRYNLEQTQVSEKFFQQKVDELLARVRELEGGDLVGTDFKTKDVKAIANLLAENDWLLERLNFWRSALCDVVPNKVYQEHLDMEKALKGGAE